MIDRSIDQINPHLTRSHMYTLCNVNGCSDESWELFHCSFLLLRDGCYSLRGHGQLQDGFLVLLRPAKVLYQTAGIRRFLMDSHRLGYLFYLVSFSPHKRS